MYGGHKQFDENAAFSGGGFMPFQATQTTTEPQFFPAKVKFVGILLNKAERVTNIQFILHDGTGRIDCHRWINEAVET